MFVCQTVYLCMHVCMFVKVNMYVFIYRPMLVCMNQYPRGIIYRFIKWHLTIMLYN